MWWPFHLCWHFFFDFLPSLKSESEQNSLNLGFNWGFYSLVLVTEKGWDSAGLNLLLFWIFVWAFHVYKCSLIFVHTEGDNRGNNDVHTIKAFIFLTHIFSIFLFLRVPSSTRLQMKTITRQQTRSTPSLSEFRITHSKSKYRYSTCCRSLFCKLDLCAFIWLLCNRYLLLFCYFILQYFMLFYLFEHK